MRYYSLNQYCQEHFGEKLYKLSLNAGLTCPNRDGTISFDGCIFCAPDGSGAFAGKPMGNVHDQIEAAKRLIKGKTTAKRYIAYFQNYTNTYAPIELLSALYRAAISHPDIAVLSIATRPDCLGEDVLDLLSEMNAIKPVWIELGLQSMHNETARAIRRGYPRSVFEDAVRALLQRHLGVIVHVILGLPGEDDGKMLDTIRYVANSGATGIKIHLLHILKDTPLADAYARGDIDVLTKEMYLNLVTDFIEYLPEDLVIHRLTGDGAKSQLIAPQWSAHKKDVLNSLARRMEEKDTRQGRRYQKHP